MALLLLKRPVMPNYGPLEVCIIGLQFTAIVLVAFRTPPLDEVTSTAAMRVVPSIVSAGVLVRFAPEPAEWRPAAVAVLGSGTVLAIWSLVVLGASFGLVPARRELVRRGPYAFVRHPAYLGELTICISCLLALVESPSRRISHMAIAIFVFAVLVATVLWRIDAEERVMSVSPEWCDYTVDTPRRLFPRFVDLRKKN